MPSGTRTSEPVSTGMAANRPNWVSDRPSCAFMGMPSTAKIIPTAKQMVKANVLEIRTRIGLPDGEVAAVMVTLAWLTDTGNSGL
ncbi:hypothetical protein G6F57_016746 [Rhizopus arrhizus]|nr:hypothetical protein G6F57_016746 [Rhizopus arrhizus]